MEARIAKLEADVTHIQADIVEIKADMRDLRSEVRELRSEMRAGLDAVNKSIMDLTTKIADIKVWGIMLYVGLAAGMLLTMARGFKWL